MKNKYIKIKKWLFSNFQLITISLLVFTIVLIFKQQNDISNLNNIVHNLDYNIEKLKSNIDDVDGKLDNVERNLSYEIDDVKRTVRIWSK